MKRLVWTAPLICTIGLSALPAQRVLTTGRASEVDMDEAALQAATQIIEDAVARDDARGVVVLVARRGKIVLHEAFGWRDVEKQKPMAPDSMFRMASNSKSITAAAVMLLVDDGKVGLDDPIHKYFPTFNHGDSAKITVRHLLTHTSGLRIGTLFLDPLVRKSPEHPDAPNILLEVARFGEVGAEEPPGSSYSYNNPGYNTLAGLVEQLTGSYKDFLSKRVYHPLGMTDSFNHEPDADHSRMSVVFRTRSDEGWRTGWKPGDGPDVPFPRGSGGMISTAYDYAIWCQTLLNGGIYDGKRVLSADIVAEAVNPQGEAIPAAKAYGLGWAVSEPGGVFSHSGSDGTMAWVDPVREIIGCVFTQSPGGPGRAARATEFQKLVTAACTDTIPVRRKD